ncbi:hypothetical protein PXJ20_16520 [Paraburkholderia sp. A1RI_3L]
MTLVNTLARRERTVLQTFGAGRFRAHRFSQKRAAACESMQKVP